MKEKISNLAGNHIKAGRKVVVVQGLGFVGIAVATVIASSVDKNGDLPYFVIGVDLPQNQDRLDAINEGKCPLESPDPELPNSLEHAVVRQGNLRASSDLKAYELADVIVVDIGLNVIDRFTYDANGVSIELEKYKESISVIGNRMKEDALVIIESTVPIGMTEDIVLPLLKEKRAKRGLREMPYLAHAYERVMPGPNYLSSIRSYPRVYAGIDESSRVMAYEFLKSFIDTETYSVGCVENTKSSELAKLLENSYRAANIAFIHEWTLLAEKLGINLFEVIDLIVQRKGTHDNMRRPGFGVGGYCLTKDSLLAQWSATRLYNTGVTLDITLNALRVNNDMPLHTLGLVKELSGGKIAGKKIALMGASYLPGMPDTRNTPSAILVQALLKEGSHVAVHDPFADSFEDLPDFPISHDMNSVLQGADGIVIGICHEEYVQHDWAGQLGGLSPVPFIVDAQNILTDNKAIHLSQAGSRLLGVGKGHWRTMNLQHA